MKFLTDRFASVLVSIAMVFAIGCAPAGSSTPVAAPVNPNPAPKPPDVAIECGSIQLAASNFTYCHEKSAVTPTATPTTHPVFAYIFHGLGGSARWPFDRTTAGSSQVADMFALASKTQSGANIIKVGVSIGSNGVVREQAVDILSLAFPQIENKLIGKTASRRILVGASMGGHNVLRVGGQDTTAFEGLAALCPAIVTFNPFNQSEIDAYKARNRAVLDEPAIDQAIQLFRATFRSTPEWNANNPMFFVNEGRYNNLPIHLSIGDKDGYGFLEGTAEFKNIRDQQFPGTTTFAVVPNARHCAFDAQALIRFMVGR